MSDESVTTITKTLLQVKGTWKMSKRWKLGVPHPSTIYRDKIGSNGESSLFKMNKYLMPLPQLYQGKIDMSELLPSQYTEDIEMFRQVSNP